MARFAFALTLCAAACVAGDFTWKDLGDGRMELRESGRQVLVYNYGPQLPAGVPEDRRRSGYIHPVYSPAGAMVTDDFPRDHYHHRGLFWAWPVVLMDGKRLDGWMLRGLGTRFEKWLAPVAGGKDATLAVENSWYAGEEKVAVEQVRLRVLPAAGGGQELDVQLSFEATGKPLTLKGSAERGKSYGGLCLRFAPRTDTVLKTELGILAKDEDLVRHPWAALEATYQGKRAGMRIDNDPSNPTGDPEWCLRHYGFVGASFPGQAGHTLEPGKPLKLRYRVKVYDIPSAPRSN